LNSTKPVSAACIAVFTSPPVTKPVLAEATLPITGVNAGVDVGLATVRIFVLVELTVLTVPWYWSVESIVTWALVFLVKVILVPAVSFTTELSVPDVDVKFISTSKPLVVAFKSYLS